MRNRNARRLCRAYFFGGGFNSPLSPKGEGGSIFGVPVKLHYVYLLQSESHPNQRYTGLTSDIKARLTKHNEGGFTHTSHYRPWTLQTYAAFQTREQAAQFERYLKSGSGRAFANRHLWPI